MSDEVKRVTEAIMLAAQSRGLDLTDYSDHKEEIAVVLAKAAIKAIDDGE